MSSLVSDVKIFKSNGKVPSILANGSALISGVVCVKFTVIKGEKGPFISLPSRKGTDRETQQTKYYPEVWFPEKDTYQKFQQEVLAEFKKSDVEPVTTEEPTDNYPF